MTSFYIPPPPLSRRAFLRGAGVSLTLPLLDAMARAADPAAAPRRMVAVQTNMGIMPEFFFPKATGPDYEPTPYLDLLKDHRTDLTVFSGVSHPGVDGGHMAEESFLSAAPHPGSGAFKNTISLDQFAAERIGGRTRFPSLTLLVSSEGHYGMAFTRGGVKIPGEMSPAALYRRMFVQGTPAEVDARVEDLRRGRSLLDFVGESAGRVRRDVGPKDRDRLDQYFTAVRELEGQLAAAQEWERRPKPKAPAPPPTDVADRRRLIERTRLMFDMVRLALETDSTRLVTVFVNTSTIVPMIPGVTRETHSLTHHGNQPETVAELRKVEEAQFKALAELLAGLKVVAEKGETLLDRTMVLYGTCMGSANAHSNTNLPVLLAGGGFKHVGHLAFDRQRNYPLPNLFVSMLQRLGVEADRFASGTGTMRGLEMAG